MRGVVLCGTFLVSVVWVLHLPPPVYSISSTISPTPLISQTLASFPSGLQSAPEGPVGHQETRGYIVSSLIAPAVHGHGSSYEDKEPLATTTFTTFAANDDTGGDHEGNVTEAAVRRLPPGSVTVQLPDVVSVLVTRSSVSTPTLAFTTTIAAATSHSSSSDDARGHRLRHHHAAAPLWLKPHLDALPAAKRRSASRRFEEKIGAVFRGVAYGGSTSYRTVPLRRQDTREVQAAPRIERTTAVSEEPQNDNLSGGGEGGGEGGSNESLAAASPQAGDEGYEAAGERNETVVPRRRTGAGSTTDSEERDLLELHEYDPETYDQYEGHYADLSEHRPRDVTGEGDATAGVTSQWQVHLEKAANGTEAPPTTTATAASPTTATARTRATPLLPRRPVARLSWLDVLRCTHRGLAWILVNFFLGFLLLSLSLLGPYRLLTMRCCTPLLPRTHYVAVHLLVFVATSLKAVYLFHLAFGSRGRLPLVLLLLLTNTGYPCLISAFLVLMMMMFVAADVQVYKSKLCTAHNTFVLVVVMLGLAFVADVIVGCAQSRSVLLLSRVMIIAVVAAAVLLFARKQQAVLAVSRMMKREFQGELKLLVLPAKDDSLQRQMGVKHILRSRLGMWCRTVRVSAAALALLSLIHLLHTIFLVSAHVPAWAWWLFHVSGCLVEAILALSTCVAAALTQRYDESVSFPFNFLVPPILLRGSGAASTRSVAAAATVANDAEAIYQRVSFSSGTESTQYTACCPEAVLAGTPQAPRRRGASVKRSATFSHAPHQPHAATHVYGTAAGQLHVARVGSASNLPLYGPSSAQGALYSPAYGPPSDSSVLVHEDGFVRVRTPLDRREAAPRPHGSLILLQQAHFRGSSPQLRGTAGQEAPLRSDAFSQSLSRRPKNSRGADVLRNNIDVSESEYQSSPSSRIYGRHSNLPSPHSPARDEADYRSLSRRSGRGLHPERDSYDYHSLSWRRGGHREARDTYLNNLDRPESDHRNLARRQVSREDNNDPVHHHHHHHDSGHYTSRRGSRDARAPTLNVYEDQDAPHSPSTLSGSPGLPQKITNRSFSPSSPSTPPAVHVSHAAASPLSKREARFPKPFVRLGSNRSLQGDDLYYYGDYIPRGNPVRRNHSSAGYYPSRYLAPSTPSLVEAQRYGSLRLGKTRKRQPHYMFTPDGKLMNRYPEEWMKERGARTPDDPLTSMNGTDGGEGEEGGAAPPRECPSRQSTSSKRSDEDWAIELIKSSSMLTDFYSLTPDQKKAKRKEMEREKEEILEEQEE